MSSLIGILLYREYSEGFKHFVDNDLLERTLAMLQKQPSSNVRIEEPPQSFIDIVVGGQVGSEGKGAVTAYLARENDYAAGVRPGSSNAGHTVYDDDGNPHIQQVIPSPGIVDEDVELIMAAESSFGVDEITDEIERFKSVFDEKQLDRLFIDPKSAVIQEYHREMERDRGLGEDIGSTVHGCGAIRSEKIWRSAGDIELAESVSELEPYVDGRVVRRLLRHGRSGQPIIIEGTQGTQLSMNHSSHYPFTTSRDCTATAFCSSTGLPPSAVRDVWVVFRTYPIRAGQNSGPLDTNEIDFGVIADRAGYDELPTELASVTERDRRVFEWSWEQAKDAIELNDPNNIAITFLDYLDAENYAATSFGELTEDTQAWVSTVSTRLTDFRAEIGLLKTGPQPDHIIDLRDTEL